MNQSKLSRSVYVGQIRRAFLLRAHPDRFRAHEKEIQSQQAKLVAAIGERFNDKDFQGYVGNAGSMTTVVDGREKDRQFFLERRDGSLLSSKLRLTDTPYQILSDIAKALEASGAVVSLPPLPPATTAADFTKDFDPLKDLMKNYASKNSYKYNLKSREGRNLLKFISEIDRSHIEERKSSRLAASTAALVARRLYSFQSIDGTRTGWSSDSFLKVVKALIHLHDEHGSTLHSSFYPLKLAFSSNDLQEPFDFYGGEILLHPGMTPTQWLPILQSISAGDIDSFRHNRTLLHERQGTIQKILGIQISKGHSCGSKDFHQCIERLVSHSQMVSPLSTDDDDGSSCRFLSLEGLKVVVESPQASRIPRVTATGGIQINSQITFEELIRTIERLESSVKKTITTSREDKSRHLDMVERVQWELGLQSVKHAGQVTHNQCAGTLFRMLEQKDSIRTIMSGLSILISGSGRSCHIGDDGSLIIPHDFI